MKPTNINRIDTFLMFLFGLCNHLLHLLVDILTHYTAHMSYIDITLVFRAIIYITVERDG